jgi:hypothetical protein
MKNIILFLLLLPSVSLYAQSTLTFTNLDANSSGGNALFDSSGNLIPHGQGSISIGFFNGLTNSQIIDSYNMGDLAGLNDSFQSWLTSPISINVDPSAPGLFSDSVPRDVSDDPPLNTIFIGQNIFLWVSTGSDFTDLNNEYFIYTWGTTFPFNNNNAEVFLREGQGTILIGEFGNFVNDFGFGSGVQTGFNTVEAVPEPSTYAAIVGLLALAIVGFRRFRS